MRRLIRWRPMRPCAGALGGAGRPRRARGCPRAAIFARPAARPAWAIATVRVSAAPARRCARRCDFAALGQIPLAAHDRRGPGASASAANFAAFGQKRLLSPDARGVALPNPPRSISPIWDKRPLRSMAALGSTRRPRARFCRFGTNPDRARTWRVNPTPALRPSRRGRFSTWDSRSGAWKRHRALGLLTYYSDGVEGAVRPAALAAGVRGTRAARNCWLL